MAEKTKKKIGPVKYLAQVREEARKVVWPTWRETLITTIMVVIVMVLFGIFFFIVDWISANLVTFLLHFGRTVGGGSGV